MVYIPLSIKRATVGICTLCRYTWNPLCLFSPMLWSSFVCWTLVYSLSSTVGERRLRFTYVLHLFFGFKNLCMVCISRCISIVLLAVARQKYIFRHSERIKKWLHGAIAVYFIDQHMTSPCNCRNMTDMMTYSQQTTLPANHPYRRNWFMDKRGTRDTGSNFRLNPYAVYRLTAILTEQNLWQWLTSPGITGWTCDTGVTNDTCQGAIRQH